MLVKMGVEKWERVSEGLKFELRVEGEEAMGIQRMLKEFRCQ